MADAAIKQAYWAALTSGSSVIEAREGALVEVFPDGTCKTIKSLPPPTRVAVGQQLQRRGTWSRLFDNSHHERVWIAEITDGVTLELKTDSLPGWFEKAVWDPFRS